MIENLNEDRTVDEALQIIRDAMENNDSAFPNDFSAKSVGTTVTGTFHGLTRLEYFAGKALSGYSVNDMPLKAAERSLKAAKELIRLLDEEKKDS